MQKIAADDLEKAKKNRSIAGLTPFYFMKKLEHIGQSVYLVAVVFFVVVSTPMSAMGQTSTPAPIVRVKRLNGWPTPAMKGLNETGRDRIFVNGLEVIETRSRFRRMEKSTLLDFEAQSEGSVIFSISNVLIRDVIKYSANSHVFAYQITHTPYTISEDGVVRVQGALITRFFVDEDGDGKYEIMLLTNKLPASLPGWLRGR